MINLWLTRTVYNWKPIASRIFDYDRLSHQDILTNCLLLPQVDMQIVINEQLKNKLSSEEQEAKLRKTQLNNSNGGSPSGKNSLTANLIATSTLNRNKERFFRLFNMSTNKATSKPNGTSEKKPTSNNSSTNNAAKASTTTTKSNSKTTTATTVNRTERTTKTNVGRSKSVNSTNKANSISTISGNKPVNVSS